MSFVMEVQTWLPSKRSTFILKGIVKGVFGWPAIHTRKGEKEEPLKSVICSST
jgi:hypothetical protein